MTDFTGKVVLINGGTRGLGAEIASQVFQQGGKVVITGRTSHQGLDVVSQLGGDTSKVMFVQMDCTVESEVIALHEKILSNPDFGGIDFAVNNLGLEDQPPGPIETCSEEVFDSCIRVKAKAAFLGMKHQIRYFKSAAKKGSIVNISSMIGLGGHAFVPAYSAANGAVQAMTKSVACEVGCVGIRVNCVCPGAINDTPMLHRFCGGADGSSGEKRQGDGYLPYLAGAGAKYPLGRLVEVSEVAKATLFLLSDASSFITGHCLPVEGGCVMSLNHL